MSTLTRTTNRLTAVFDTRAQAEAAVDNLRNLGISDDRLAIVTQNENPITSTAGVDRSDVAAAHDEDVDEYDNAGERAGKGALAGAGVGVLFGLAALAIPGVGPFITAGFLTSALGATGGAVVSGALVGAVSGGVAGAFAKAGYNEDEARFYGDAVERGSTVVAVDVANDAGIEPQIRNVLSQNGGHFSN